MIEQEKWLKFIITGKIDDYLEYKTNCKKANLYGGGQNSFFDRRPCDKGREYRG